MLDDEKAKDDYNILELFSSPIDCLGLSVRSFNCLKRAGISFVYEVEEIIDNGTINDIRNLNEKCINEIKEKINQCYCSIIMRSEIDNTDSNYQLSSSVSKLELTDAINSAQEYMEKVVFDYELIDGNQMLGDSLIDFAVTGRFDFAFERIVRCLESYMVNSLSTTSDLGGTLFNPEYIKNYIQYHFLIPKSEIGLLGVLNIVHYIGASYETEVDTFLCNNHPIYNLYAKIKQLRRDNAEDLYKELYEHGSQLVHDYSRDAQLYLARLYDTDNPRVFGDSEQARQLWSFFKVLFPDAKYWYHEDWMNGYSITVFIPSLRKGILYTSRDITMLAIEAKENGIELIKWERDEKISYVNLSGFLKTNGLIDNSSIDSIRKKIIESEPFPATVLFEAFTAKQQIKKRIIKKSKRKRVIRKYSVDGEYLAEFDSAEAAAQDCGRSVYTMQDTLKGRQNTCGGFIWRRAYNDDPKEDIIV